MTKYITTRNRLDDFIRAGLFQLSPLALVRYRYWRATGKWYRPGNPRTFDEKLLWLMLHWRHPLKSRCADKYAVRSYVEEYGLGHLLPQLLGVYSAAEEIPFEALPDRFALKATHGSNFNIICRDKRSLDIAGAIRTVNGWLNVDISRIGGELHYASIPPRVICEELLEDRPGEAPTDYKVYCFDGLAHCTMACTGRTEKGANFDFYNLNWSHKLPYSKDSLSAGREVARPAGYEVMIDAAERLSKPFPFVRVDFYSILGRVVFGEMTFTPHGCIDTDFTDVAQNTLGELVRLPARMPNLLTNA